MPQLEARNFCLDELTEQYQSQLNQLSLSLSHTHTHTHTHKQAYTVMLQCLPTGKESTEPVPGVVLVSTIVEFEPAGPNGEVADTPLDDAICQKNTHPCQSFINCAYGYFQ